MIDRMSDKMKAFWLGLFIIVALVLLCWLILFLKPRAGDGGVILKVRFSNIDKVTKGTRVTFAGRPVGEVKSLKEVPDPREAPADAAGNLYIYELTLEVDSCVQVYTYDEILFATSGLLGEKSIAINPKATPPGAPPACNVSCEILFAHSIDRLEQTLNKLVNVSETFESTLQKVSGFIETNNHDFGVALKSMTNATTEMHTFMVRANETDVAGRAAHASDSLITAMTKAEDFFTAAQNNSLIERMGNSFEYISTLTGQMAGGEGTFARLVNSDCLYLQFSTALCQFQALLEDMRNYGLLYQFDRKWQRKNDQRRACTEMRYGS